LTAQTTNLSLINNNLSVTAVYMSKQAEIISDARLTSKAIKTHTFFTQLAGRLYSNTTAVHTETFVTIQKLKIING